METLSEKVSLGDLKHLEDYKDVVLDKTESPLSPLTASTKISAVNGRADCRSPPETEENGESEVSARAAATTSSLTASADDNDRSTENSKVGSDKNSCAGYEDDDDGEDDDDEDDGGGGGGGNDEDDDDDDNLSCKKTNEMDTASLHSPSSSSSSRSISSPMMSPSISDCRDRPHFSKGPSLFQPFLPTFHPQQIFQAVNNHPIQQLQSQFLPFSIENILRPSFGHPRLLSNPLLDLAATIHQQQKIIQQEHIKRASALVATPGSTLRENILKTKSPESGGNNHNIIINNNNNPQAKPKGVSHSTSTNQPVDLSSKSSTSSESESKDKDDDVPPGMVRGPNGQLWPAWVFCTRYSDRPSSGPRTRKIKKPCEKEEPTLCASAEKRPRTAFSSDQLARLKREFEDNRYLNEERRKSLSNELGLNENQIKIWFQNKRAKIKKSNGSKGELAQMLMAQGLYNHSTIPVDDEENPIF